MPQKSIFENNESVQSAANKWINHYIKPDHRDEVRGFLDDPINNSLTSEISAVIDFDVTSLDPIPVKPE